MDDWRPVKEFDQYEVSSRGRVRNRNNGVVLMPSRNRSGLQVNLYENGIAYARAVHKLVAEAFLIHFSGEESLIHIDGNNENNVYYNLRYTSRSFAYRWTQQSRRKTPIYRHKIKVVETNEMFKNSHDAAMTLIGLEEDLVNAIDAPDVTYLNRHFETL